MRNDLYITSDNKTHASLKEAREYVEKKGGQMEIYYNPPYGERIKVK